MKIGIDCRFIQYKHIDGIGRFTLSLCREFFKNNQSNQYYLICNSPDQIEFLKSRLTTEYQESCVKYFIAKFFQLPAIIKNNKINIFFSPNYITVPLSSICPHIVVVHDLIPLLFSQYFNKASLKFRLFFTNKWVINSILKNITHIISVSGSTKNDIVKHLGIQENKISIITEGADKIDIDLQKQIIDKYNLPCKYILYVGRFDPYKNISLLLKIYSQLEDLKEIFFLVLAGKEDRHYTPYLKQMAKDLNINDKVIFLGFVPPDELPPIYRKAELLVHPSMYEGFGLSVLEAMTYGTPVIAFNVSSIPEVTGDCGVLINPYDEKAFLQGIIDLLTNENKRNELATKAKQRASNFTWDRTAREVLEILTKYQH